jgi:hypothetical protein
MPPSRRFAIATRARSERAVVTAISCTRSGSSHGAARVGKSYAVDGCRRVRWTAPRDAGIFGRAPGGVLVRPHEGSSPHRFARGTSGCARATRSRHCCGTTPGRSARRASGPSGGAGHHRSTGLRSPRRCAGRAGSPSRARRPTSFHIRVGAVGGRLVDIAPPGRDPGRAGRCIPGASPRSRPARRPAAYFWELRSERRGAYEPTNKEI